MKYQLYLAVLAIFVLSACKNNSHKEVETADKLTTEDQVSLTAPQAKNIDLQVAQVSMGEVSQTLKLQGKIDVPPQNLVSISIPFGGYLKSTTMLPGTKVKKGQSIAIMEDPQYVQLQQDYLNINNKLSYAKRELARQKELNLNSASSDKTYQLAETEYKNLNVERSALVEKLKLINIDPVQLDQGKISRSIPIFSPIDGYVSKVNVNIGKYVTPSDVIFELINPTDIHLNLTVFEKDLHKINIGQRVLAYTNAKTDVKHETEVILISHNIDEGGSSEVHCHFEQYDKSLVPGMYMNAELKIKSEIVQFLPENAVVSYENKEFVFEEIAERKFKMIEVIIGETNENKIAILTDLKGKKIVIKGAYSLLMKMKNTNEEE